MKKYFHNERQVIATVKDTVTLEQFKEMLNTNKPKEIINSEYSEKIACWVITEYLDSDRVKYYATGWADKTPLEESMNNIYVSWNIQGLKNCYFIV